MNKQERVKWLKEINQERIKNKEKDYSYLMMKSLLVKEQEERDMVRRIKRGEVFSCIY